MNATDGSLLWMLNQFSRLSAKVLVFELSMGNKLHQALQLIKQLQRLSGA